MKLSHIYVCDNPSNYSEFDLWLKELTSWVPSYIVIKDQKVIGVFEGGIDVDTFSDKLGTYITLEKVVCDLPDFEIENLEGTRKPIKEIFKSGTYVLEFHWIDCQDCVYQDENFTQDIYYKYGADFFYRYYIKSEKDKVLKKYKK